VLNRVKRTEISRASTVVYTHVYPITLPMVGTGQMSRLYARCLPKKMFYSLLCLFCFTDVYICFAYTRISVSCLFEIKKGNFSCNTFYYNVDFDVCFTMCFSVISHVWISTNFIHIK